MIELKHKDVYVQANSPEEGQSNKYFDVEIMHADMSPEDLSGIKREFVPFLLWKMHTDYREKHLSYKEQHDLYIEKREKAGKIVKNFGFHKFVFTYMYKNPKGHSSYEKVLLLKKREEEDIFDIHMSIYVGEMSVYSSG